MTSGQVHELKNRLTVIKGISQLLDRQVRRSEWERGRIEERVESLRNEVVRLELLVSEIAQHDDAVVAHVHPDTQAASFSDD